MELQANTDFLFELLTAVAKTHECFELFMELKQCVMCMLSRFIVGCDDLIMIQELGGCQLLKIRKQKQLQNVMNWWLETIK